ncbi:MAG: type VI secretion system tube protein Hcp [Pseudomonadota bacterium]
MPSDMFLKLDGVSGESKDESHGGEIDVLSWTWGMANASDPHLGGGGGKGKVAVGHLTFRHRADSASPILKAKCCELEHIPKGELVCRKAGGKSALEYLKITMEQVNVAAISVSVDPEGDVFEEVSLSFAKVLEEYIPQAKDGTGEGGITFERNIEENA